MKCFHYHNLLTIVSRHSVFVEKIIKSFHVKHVTLLQCLILVKDMNFEYNHYLSFLDYNAPIAENGDLTPKFHAIREIFSKMVPDHGTYTLL